MANNESVDSGNKQTKKTLTRALVVLLFAALASFTYCQNSKIKEKEVKIRELEKEVEKDLKGRVSPSEVSTGVFEVGLGLCQTASISDELYITLLDIVSIRSNGQPTGQYTVSARLMYKNLPESRIRDAKAGSSIEYPPNSGHVITILKAEPNLATFSIAQKR